MKNFENDRVEREKLAEENDTQVLKELMGGIQQQSRCEYETSINLSDRVQKILLDKGYMLKERISKVTFEKYIIITW